MESRIRSGTDDIRNFTLLRFVAWNKTTAVETPKDIQENKAANISSFLNENPSEYDGEIVGYLARGREVYYIFG